MYIETAFNEVTIKISEAMRVKRFGHTCAQREATWKKTYPGTGFPEYSPFLLTPWGFLSCISDQLSRKMDEEIVSKFGEMEELPLLLG